MCGVCATFNWLDRPRCRNCGGGHAVQGAQSTASGATQSRTKSAGKGKGNRATLTTAVQVAQAAGAPDATVECLRQDVAQAKQDKQSLGSRLDNGTAKLKRAQDQLRRSEEVVQTALRKQEAAAKAVEDAEKELQASKDEAAGAATTASSVVAEARALLLVLETAPLC